MIWGAVLLAAACWGFTFGWSGGNFWAKIGLSVSLVTFYSLLWQRPRIPLRFQSFVIGLLSAALLYGVFFCGEFLARLIITAAPVQVGGIYALGKGTATWQIFLLLFFITGPGEEVFWRGFLQHRSMEKWGRYPGYLFTSLIYAGVHIFSRNLILVLAAFVAGMFWGALYLWKRDLLIQIVSHSFWSAFIFAVVPVGG